MNELSNDKLNAGFASPAFYTIKVSGRIPLSMTDILLGMDISYIESEARTISTLKGLLKDQTALSGVLNILYDMHYTVLSVKKGSKISSNNNY
jgi:hypothetical protein